jgi:hypothetical protein
MDRTSIGVASILNLIIMKKVIKYLSYTALSGVLCVSLALTASAQHDHSSGGGGGGSRPSGGGGGGYSAPHVSAPSPSHVSVSQPRTTTSVQRTSTVTAQRNYGTYRQTGTVQRNIITTTNRSQYQGHNAPKSGGSSVQTYRTYQGNSYGKNHLPYYHYNHGYYGSYYAPRLGFTVGFLPFGYYPFYYGDYQYFYSDGLFYEYNNDQYTVVEPPVGAEVTTLPANAQSIVINGQQYYEADGVYYMPITKDDGTLSYQVAGEDGQLNTGDAGSDAAPAPPQIGDIVTDLPPNCKKLNINGDRLFVSPDGIYYKAQVDQNNNTTYKIVGLPADDGQGN